MAKPDWGAIESAYRAGVMSLREIGALYGVTEGAIRKKARKLEWVRKGGTQLRKKGTQAKSTLTTAKLASRGGAQKSPHTADEHPAKTKPIRGKRTSPPTNPFQPGNQHALKHGGYARRMLLPDAVTEDAALLTLDDELFWLRAANLTAAENIGRWSAALEYAEDEERKTLLEDIGAAQKAMHRNTSRIESLELTKAAIEHRMASAEKAALDADKLRKELAAEPEQNEPTPVAININVVDARAEGDDGNITNA
ncbi:hypothetical protein C5952_17610 [Cronobacter sakazakii]|uniref:hypothetical protein n=1 Tax=Cronobacter TaxID=413496 RepID=UPI000A115D20|nr:MULTISPECIES: hypothetical protein [Cronobacter]ELY6202300.1 hypothetical protein [Cronobacter malonaticus]ELY6256175.1 hypothetical protein [Cronobacter malonaticus]ELY6360308.1 hypothetical protein [Cronobacter sakazakii]NCH01539.1 hypothetical protein [Cronobacter malonaticus]PQX62841.1 hypothetical protein C5952_17610 [Cronobacter sakazakii]